MAVITITGSPTKPFFFFFPIVFPRWPGDRTSDAKGVALPPPPLPPPLPPPPLLATFGVVVIPNCLRDAAMCHGSASLLLLLLVSAPLIFPFHRCRNDRYCVWHSTDVDLEHTFILRGLLVEAP